MTASEKKTALSVTLSAVLILLCGVILIVLFPSAAGYSTGAFILLLGITSLLLIAGKPFSDILPSGLKKMILMHIIVNIAVLISMLIGVTREETINYCLNLNNRTNPDDISGSTILLLPRCIQDSQCTSQLSDDIKNCAGCGKCQVAAIIEAAEGSGISIKLVGGGTLALEQIKELAPDRIIAVACENELLDGMKRTLHIPVWAVNNIRPEGPCKNTRVDMDVLDGMIRRVKS
jgi:hypothetical protein